MFSTCNGRHVSKMIQIRHVPDEVHRSLKSKAAAAGMTLSDYLLAEVTHVAARSTFAEWAARVEALGPPIASSETGAESVRRARAEA